MSRWQIIFWGRMLAVIIASLALSIKTLIGD